MRTRPKIGLPVARGTMVKKAERVTITPELVIVAVESVTGIDEILMMAPKVNGLPRLARNFCWHLMRKYCGMNVREIADRYGVYHNAVYMALIRMKLSVNLLTNEELHIAEWKEQLGDIQKTIKILKPILRRLNAEKKIRGKAKAGSKAGSKANGKAKKQAVQPVKYPLRRKRGELLSNFKERCAEYLEEQELLNHR